MTVSTHSHDWTSGEDCPVVGCYRILRFEGLTQVWALGGYNVPDETEQGYHLGHFGTRVQGLKYHSQYLTDAQRHDFPLDIASEAFHFLSNMRPEGFDAVAIVPSNRRDSYPIMQPVAQRLIESNLCRRFIAVERSEGDFSLKSIAGRDARLEKLCGRYRCVPEDDHADIYAVLLVDDVTETGATMTGMARTINEAYPAASVYGLSATYITEHGAS